MSDYNLIKLINNASLAANYFTQLSRSLLDEKVDPSNKERLECELKSAIDDLNEMTDNVQERFLKHKNLRVTPD